MIIEATDAEEAKRLIRKNKGKSIFVKAGGFEFNRKLIEFGGLAGIIFSAESLVRAQREEAVNLKREPLVNFDRVMARFAREKNVLIVVDLRGFFSREKVKCARNLAGLAQLAKICAKERAELRLVNYKSKRNAQALLHVLSCPTDLAKRAVRDSFLTELKLL
ncbi:hypothetical protein D6817_04120 [Candidatus Pacearchaeota archaeon]|nr:MAG: hypothetical protein D6817_04120 [Candidatus Pacearchaeota archaeon]